VSEERNRGWSSEEYARLAGFDGGWRDSWWNQDFLELMAGRWEFGRVESLLDVGCGAGHWGQRLATVLPWGARIVGVDHEPRFLETARERAGSLGIDADFDYRPGRAEELPFGDDTFDVVTCQTVLIHVGDPVGAIEEMIRVTRPGGLVIASEPNNLVNVLIDAMSEPRLPFEETLRLLRFDQICHAGKIALGQGDASIGERLPALFTELGLGDVRTYKNDRSPALVPPYDDPLQRLDLEQLLAWAAEGVSGWGKREDVLPLFVAGGGSEAEFESYWQSSLARLEAFRANVEAGRFSGARGFVQYLVSGTKATA